MAEAGQRRPGPVFHPDRQRLIAEAHARPASELAMPMLVGRMATLAGDDGLAADRHHLSALCTALDQDLPTDDARWWAIDAGGWRLRWERHTEFSTWTVYRTPTGHTPFVASAFDAVPSDWLAAMPGEVLVATKLEYRSPSDAGPPANHFIREMAGSQIADGALTLFSDFYPDAEGWTRYLMLGARADRRMAGRIALGILEIETYRLLAMLAFPVAGRVGAQVKAFEVEAEEIARRLAEETGLDQDRQLLQRLVSLAGQAEAINTRTSYRFGAARAYRQIVRDRVDALGEQPIAGIQTVAQFMERRFAPAMRTCDSVAERERAVIDRIARTAQMLETRVEVAARAGSSALLASMDRRARQSYQLQRTVEGLSVVAISYYAVGLVGFVAKAIEKLDHRIDATLLTGLLTLPVVAMIWLGIRRLAGRFDHTG